MTRYAEKRDNPEERITPEKYNALPFEKRKQYKNLLTEFLIWQS